MQRRSVLGSTAGALLCLAAPAAAQVPVRRIGYLVQSPLTDPPSRERAAFLDELAKLGYQTGRNLLIEYRSAENEPEFLPDLARELVKARVELIVAAGGVAATAAKAASADIPIVFTQHPDPVGSGLVKSLARPGGNATGVSFVSPDLAGKRLELLRELLPGARRVLLLYGRYATGMSDEVQVSLRAATKLGLRLEALAVDSAEALVRAFEARAQARPDAVLVIADLKMVAYRDILVEQAGRLRLPMLAGWPDLVRAGALASYSPDFADLFRRSAHHVDRILRGARPADLPVEQPTRFTMLLNLRNARALGLRVANSALLRADEVIE